MTASQQHSVLGAVLSQQEHKVFQRTRLGWVFDQDL